MYICNGDTISSIFKQLLFHYLSITLIKFEKQVVKR
jgi:hypothetical protein